MNWRKLLPVVLILLMAVGMVSGCGGSTGGSEPSATTPSETTDEKGTSDQSTTTDETTTTDDPGSDTIDVSGWVNPRNLSDLLDTFQELVWSWADLEQGEAINPTTIGYKLLGTETIDGVNTTKIQLDIDDQQWIIWMDAEDKVVQAESDGSPMADEFAGMMVQAMVTAVFWPFMMADSLDVIGAFKGTTGFDTELSSPTRERFGSLDATVTRVKVTLGPPYTEPGNEVELTWAVGDFGKFQMLVEWTSSGKGESDFAFQMKVEKVVPR